MLLKGDSVQLAGLVTGALLRVCVCGGELLSTAHTECVAVSDMRPPHQDLRGAYCALHTHVEHGALQEDAPPDAREAFNELLMHFYHSAIDME